MRTGGVLDLVDVLEGAIERRGHTPVNGHRRLAVETAFDQYGTISVTDEE
jgi:hypothetical protein